jgi:flavin-dependent dehydrogenase
MISEEPSRPVRIAGAGPAGLAAAITLARAGRRVEVHEAKRDVGARFIGDIQIIENHSSDEQVPDLLARIGLETNFYFRPARGASFYDHRGRARSVSSETPFGFFIHRGPSEGTLDRGLLAQARAAGVDVRFESRIDPATAEIVATGPATPDGLAKEITFASTEEERVEVFFDHEVSPGGYSYLFILDGVATFGCAIVADFKQIDLHFDHALAAAKRFRPFTVPLEIRTGYSYMNFHVKERATADGARYAGEAGGFQDYLFGLGIRYALTTGHLAARSILEQTDYDQLWQREFPGRQQTSLVNRFLYEIGGNAGLGQFVRQAAGARDFRSYLYGWHQQTWWKRLLFPLVAKMWRHKGRCLHKPGDHWCRARDTEMKVPPLGPVENHDGN